MDLKFNSSEFPTIGAELELQLIDPATRNLTSAAINVLKECRERQFDRIKKEIHQSMIELDTPICQSVKECRAHLNHALVELTDIAGSLNLRVAISGTHPFQKWTDRQFFPAARYLFIHRKYRWLAKRINVYGLHVHVGVENGDEAIRISNAMIRYLPFLLALSASSPYWGGEHTGVSSCRIGIMECFPYSGIPPHFSNWKEFSSYYNLLRQTQAITSLKDLYWHVRPNPMFGTLEFRICDGMPTLSETAALIALTQSLVKWAKEDKNMGTSSSMHQFDRLVAPENLWRAARDGLKAMLIIDENGQCRPIIDEIRTLLETLEPVAMELDCREELSFIHNIINNGTSADRQRNVFRNTKDLVSVVDSLIEELQTDTYVQSFK
ncbi:MAG TPA: YbdK family carboxylate-amine ligase [Rhabdochlamydiaceae bacterium]|nr:YbdK family carboxylate-amine ligase [Rhabdochlamydiaceae bacterium]